MHYLRLLRPPTLVKSPRPGPGTVSLSLVLAITTDLGESFLCPDAPIGIAVELEVEAVEAVKADENDTDEGGGHETPDVSHSAVEGRAANWAAEDGSEPPSETHRRPKTRWHRFDLSLSAAASGKGAKGSKASKLSSSSVTGGGGSGTAWKAGMRVLKLEASLPDEAAARLWETPKNEPSRPLRRRFCIRPAEKSLSATHAQQLTQIRAGAGLIMPLWVDVPAAGEPFPHVACRQLCINYGSDDNGGDFGAAEAAPCIEVEEEIGESIARHVWDAGLVTVAYLAETCLKRPTRKRPRSEDGSHSTTSLAEALRGLLARAHSHKPKHDGKHDGLRILELGSGVGILGIGLAAVLQEGQAERAAANSHSPAATTDAPYTVLLTDLPEAEERARSNMARSGRGLGQHLAYANLDWEDGRAGRFDAAVGDTPWHLVVLSDCTYNVDMLPALVETLSALRAAAREQEPKRREAPSILLARKPRHASEEALFALMTEHGWVKRAAATVPLPVLDGDDQVVEIYLYEDAH